MLSMTDIEMLDILAINCYAIDTQTSNKEISKWQTEEPHTNKLQDVKAQRQCNANTNNNTNPVDINKDNSKTNGLFPGPNQETDRRTSAKCTADTIDISRCVLKVIG